MKSKIKQKNNWQVIEGEQNLFTRDAGFWKCIVIPVKGFVNTATGEVRLFSSKYVEVNGSRKIETYLNEKQF